MIDRSSVSKSYFIFMIIYLAFEAENWESLFTEESFLHTLFGNVYFQNKSVIFFSPLCNNLYTAFGSVYHAYQKLFLFTLTNVTDDKVTLT